MAIMVGASVTAWKQRYAKSKRDGLETTARVELSVREQIGPGTQPRLLIFTKSKRDGLGTTTREVET